MFSLWIHTHRLATGSQWRCGLYHVFYAYLIVKAVENDSSTEISARFHVDSPELKQSPISNQT